MADKLLLTVREAQDVLSIGRSKLYELIASGALPVVHIGRAIRLPAKELEKWVNDQKQVKV